MDWNKLEIWRIIPPEEKVEALNKAHARGILVTVITLIIMFTLAVAFKAAWLVWSSLLLVPFIFQFAAGKEWRTLRPKMLLEYLAARAAARRFAFTVRANELEPKLIFRGYLEELYSNDELEELFGEAVDRDQSMPVWITLFKDAVVIMKEEPGGARLEFGHLLNDKLQVHTKVNGEDEYSAEREIILQATDRKARRRVKITSDYPAALLVFDKKLKEYMQEYRDKWGMEEEDLHDREDSELMAAAG
ncbi:MAG: hypothetical protein D6719_10515 [Candidatus Dadabacteria bacterium]|nr:MAG: hypothetical protein D6719_10515 [Candidatus Dadabacteria bacterium]